MRIKIMIVLIPLLVSAQDSGDVHSLAAAERAFSAASDSFGINVSFLRFLAEECIMFNPGPVNGRELYRKRKENGINLTWKPLYVELSRSGEFGVSTGPWEIRKTKNDSVSMVGHFFSVWERESNGEWKVILDNGINYPKEKRQPETERFVGPKRTSHGADGTGKIRMSLTELEMELNSRLTKGMAEEVFRNVGAKDLRVYRDGDAPVIGNREGAKLIGVSQPRSFTPLGSRTAKSGELGFVYGTVFGAKGDTSSYVHLWRFDGKWELAADLLIPYSR